MGCGASRVHPIAQTRPLSESELAALRDARGALSEQAAAQLRRAAFERGVEPDARAGLHGAWPLLLGVFPMGSTTAEREELMAQKKLAYEEHRAAGAALAADPAFKDGSVIVHDVHRTQADHQLHEAHKPLMTEVLRAYAAFDPDVGYGQGMSDMLAVILYTLEDAALSFWCFVAVLAGSTCSNGLRNDDARRLHLAKDVDDAASSVLGRLANVLERQLPKLHAHLVSCSCTELLFCYPYVGRRFRFVRVVWCSFGAMLGEVLSWSTFLLTDRLACTRVVHSWVKMLLKRELPFEEVPRLWEACWCASTGLTEISANVQGRAGGGDGGPGSSDGATMTNGAGRTCADAGTFAASEDFVLFCCAAILQRKQKELIKSCDSLEHIFQCLRGVQSHAPELVQQAARLARGDMKRNRAASE